MLYLKRICRCCLFSLLLMLILGGCGNGSGTTSVSRTTSAKTSLKTSGLVSSGLLVGALEVAISIPYGVTVELDPLTNEPSRSVVTLVGTADPAMTMSALNYIPATPTAKGSLKIIYLNAAGFKPSDSLSIQLGVATGFFPQATDFALTKFEVTAMSSDGNTIYSATPVQNPSFTIDII